MNKTTENALSKVPELTLIFWIIKIAATTLGETGGDSVSMSMNLGYLVGTGIFTAFFILAFWTSPSMRGTLTKPLCCFGVVVRVHCSQYLDLSTKNRKTASLMKRNLMGRIQQG